jgi:hypothetical protein
MLILLMPTVKCAHGADGSPCPLCVSRVCMRSAKRALQRLYDAKKHATRAASVLAGGGGGGAAAAAAAAGGKKPNANANAAAK